MLASQPSMNESKRIAPNLSMLFTRLGLLLLVIGLTSGCATSAGLNQARYEFASGAPVKALSTLEQTPVSKRNELLLLLDRGTIAFSAGKYTVATDALLEASYLVEELDKLRVSEQSASLVTSDLVTRYQGEASEQLWIHSYLMMAFLLQGNAESAAVEARRALQKLDDNEDVLRSDWFTRALIAASFEASGAFDSAEVEYRRLLEDPDYDGSWNHVIQRLTKRLGRGPIDGGTHAAHSLLATANTLHKNEGELIVFLQSGYIAEKLPGDIIVDVDLRITFPYYENYPRSTPSYTVISDGELVAADVIETDLTQVAIDALDKRATTLAIKQVARIAAKNALVNAAARESDLAGVLTQIFVFATEQADTRSWETLPEWLGMIRIPLPEGRQDVQVELVYEGYSHRIDLGDIDIHPGRLHFATYRTGLPLPRDERESFPEFIKPPTRPESSPTSVTNSGEIRAATS